MTENPLGLKLNRITARVRDIARATAWYRDTLGFTVGETGTTPNGAMKFAYLHLPGLGISLVQLDLPATEVAPGQQLLPCWVQCIAACAKIGAWGIESLAEQMMPGFPDLPDTFYEQFKGWMEKYGTVSTCHDSLGEHELELVEQLRISYMPFPILGRDRKKVRVS
jgi:Glyoxalase/Bleomycin resistance protein/Dioxygenase superfamily